MSRDQHPLGLHSVRLASVGLLAAISLVVSACSSSSGSNSPASTGATSADVARGGGGGVGGATTIAATPPPTSSAASGSSGGGGTALSGSFCSIAKQEQAQTEKEATAYSGSDPASLEKLETDGLNALQKFVAIAPGAIKSDVEVIAAADQKLFNALKAAKFMIAKVDQSVLSSLNTPAFMAATSHVAAYLSTTCGIKTDPSDSN